MLEYQFLLKVMGKIMSYKNNKDQISYKVTGRE